MSEPFPQIVWSPGPSPASPAPVERELGARSRIANSPEIFAPCLDPTDVPKDSQTDPDGRVGSIAAYSDDDLELQLAMVPFKEPSRHPATNVRGRHDDFQTPPEAVAHLLPYLPPGCTVWEPAAGHGQIVQALIRAGHSVIASDVKTGQDYRQWEPSEPWDAQVTNPPFSLKTDWIARCYHFGKPWALLLPLTCLEGQKRQMLYARYGVELVCLPGRPEFTTPSGKVGGSWFACAWFTWGLNIGRSLTFSGYDAQPQGALEL